MESEEQYQNKTNMRLSQPKPNTINRFADRKIPSNALK